MEFKNKPMRWDNAGTEPSEEIKAGGFRAGYKPPAGVFNKFFHTTNQVETELQEKVSALDASKVDTADFNGVVEEIGTRPEGAGSVWENIGERPEGKTGTLWENTSSNLTPITNRLTSVETKTSVIEKEIGTGFNSTNTIMSNIGTKPYGKTGNLWTEIEKGEHSITSPAKVTLTGIGNTKVNLNNSYYIKSGNLVLLVVNCSLESTDQIVDVNITGIPDCAGKHVDFDLNVPIHALGSLSGWSIHPHLRLNPRIPSNPASISASYATAPTTSIYLTLASYAVYIAAQ